MLARTKGIAIAVGVLLCAASLLGGKPNVPGRARGVPAPAEDIAETHAVLVEAFIVEVNLPALARLGVSPIGQEPHAVSVAEILKCLEMGQARVVGGAKTASQSGDATDVQVKRTMYVRQETGTPAQVNYNPYDAGRHFSAGVRVLSDTAISVRFDFTCSRFMQAEPPYGGPRDSESWDWGGTVMLQPGIPQIVGASQEDATAIFLLLTAHVQD